MIVVSLFKNSINTIISDSLDIFGHNDAINHFKRCGHQVVDIVGVIFGLKYDPDDMNKLSNVIFPHTDQNSERYTIETVTIGSDFSSYRPIRLVDAVLPVCLSFGDKDIKNDQGIPEHTASLFQDGEVLYISSLGRLNANQERHDPVIYTLVCSHGNKYRLGRLVDRLNSLGTLRIAALRDIVALTDVSKKIDDLFDYLSQNPTGEDILSGIKSRFSEIDDQSGHAKIEYGVNYRIKQSRHYVSEFKRLLDVMETKKITGFQKYDNFVRRRVYDAFEFIDNIGDRYEDLREQIDFRLSVNQKQELASIYNSILEQTTAVSSQTLGVRKLLFAAERISIIPLTYYSSSMIEHVFHKIMDEFIKFIYSIISDEKLEADYSTYLAYSFGFFITYFILRMVRKQIEEAFPEKKPILVGRGIESQ